MEKFLRRSSGVAHHEHCIIKEELMIADSDEEIDVEKVDKEIYSNPRHANFIESQTEIQLDKHNKSNATKSENPIIAVTTEHDISEIAKKVAKSYCKKCRKKGEVLRFKSQCDKCDTPLSYTCHTNCDKTYSTFTNLSYHLKVQHIETHLTYPCSICNKTFNDMKTLMIHRRVTHKICQSKECEKCGQKFARAANKIMHEKSCDGTQIIDNQCSKCGKDFDSISNKRKLEHERHCGKEPKYKCNKCPYTARYKSNLTSHNLEKHSGFRAKCESCSKEFTNQRSFKRHTKVYCNKTKMLECHHCGHKVYRKDQMIMHLDQNHINLYDKEQLERIYKDCGLIEQGQLREKMRICKYCYETLNQRERMRNHVERCESAPLALRYSNERAKLPDMDAAMKEFAIYYCVKCKTKGPLKDRTRRCRKCEKLLRFACVGCSKNFVELDLFLKHLRLKHVRVLTFYRCDKCYRSYNREENLLSHKRDFHSGKPLTANFECKKCPKKYKSMHSLRNHKAVCGQEPKFYCEKCPYKTHFKSSIIGHIWAKRSTCI